MCKMKEKQIHLLGEKDNGHKTIGIHWMAIEPILSEKDEKLPVFDLNSNYFDLNGKWIGD